MSESVERALANFKAIFTGPLPQEIALSASGDLLARIERTVCWDDDKNVTDLKVSRAQTGDDLWIGGLPEQPRQLSWHRTRNWLAFIGKDGEKGSALFEWDIETNMLHRRFASDSGIIGFVRPPDDPANPGGFLVLRTPEKPEIVGVVEFPREVEPADLIDTRTGKSIAQLPSNATSLSLSADGKRIAFVSQPSPFGEDLWRTEVFVQDLASGERRRIGPRGRGATACSFPPLGDALALIAHQRPDYTSRTDLCVFDPDLGEERNLSRRWDHPVERILGWSDDARTVIVSAWAGVRMQYLAFEIETGERRVLREGTLFASCVTNGDVRAWIETPPGNLPQIMLKDRAEVKPPPAEACPQRIIQWPDASGRMLDSLYIEPRDSKPPWPTVLHIHGGPASPVYDALNRTDLLQPLAAAGYAVFFPAFRGSGGYEEAFTRETIGNFAEGPLDDCLRGLDALVVQGLADPKRLAVVGASYGGFLTLYTLTRSTRFRCGISMCALFDLVSDFASISRPEFLPQYIGGYPWDNLEAYWQASPMSRVKDFKTPVLVLHGDADTNTSIQHARELAFALRTLDRPFRFKSYPKEGHGFDQPKVRLDMVAESVAWLDTHMKK